MGKFNKTVLFLVLLLLFLVSTPVMANYYTNNYFACNECHWEMTMIFIDADPEVSIPDSIKFLSEQLKDYEDWEIIDHSTTWDWVIVKFKVCIEVPCPESNLYLQDDPGMFFLNLQDKGIIQE